MTCHNCNTLCKKSGKHRNGLQRFRCNQCRKTFTEDHATPLGDMRIPLDKATKAIELLVEGCSVSSTERITGIHHTTLLSLLVLAGQKCERLLEKRIKNLPVADVQCDEIWGYVAKKEAHKWISEQGREDIGDAYTFVAIERNTKLILAWHLGKRTVPHTQAFIRKLAKATAYQPYQLSTDGFPAYIAAVDDHLTQRGVDYGQLVKIYGNSREGEQRYSPPEVTSAVPHPVWGLPDVERICTSHVERQNLSMRMGIRRLTRLTNAFSKKWENLKAALALWFCFYNWCRVHKTLRMTPAMAAGITDHIWSISELLEATA
jgi:transposase-like protein/IS1 family transposase